jgi:poly-gamma-glutamate synthesis protein (capsule biosynthesis protein)
VIGHHTHIISGHEVYKGSPIFYGLGNFCFDWEGLQNGTWNKGMMLRLSFQKNTPIAFEQIFINHNNEKLGVSLMDEEEVKNISDHILNLNKIIESDIELNAAFSNYANSLKPLMNTWIEPYKGKYLPGLHKRGWIPSLISENKKMLLTNLIRCEAHRDILLHAINPTKK